MCSFAPAKGLNNAGELCDSAAWGCWFRWRGQFAWSSAVAAVQQLVMGGDRGRRMGEQKLIGKVKY
jgi:hypothetical protein